MYILAQSYGGLLILRLLCSIGYNQAPQCTHTSIQTSQAPRKAKLTLHPRHSKTPLTTTLNNKQHNINRRRSENYSILYRPSKSHVDRDRPVEEDQAWLATTTGKTEIRTIALDTLHGRKTAGLRCEIGNRSRERQVLLWLS